MHVPRQDDAVPRLQGAGMTCKICHRPIATAADEAIWQTVAAGAPMPEGWPSEDAEHLCWYAECGDGCTPDENSDAVAVAQRLIAEQVEGVALTLARYIDLMAGDVEVSEWRRDGALKEAQGAVDALDMYQAWVSAGLGVEKHLSAADSRAAIFALRTERGRLQSVLNAERGVEGLPGWVYDGDGWYLRHASGSVAAWVEHGASIFEIYEAVGRVINTLRYPCTDALDGMERAVKVLQGKAPFEKA